jgi:hypothetical protein
MDKRAKPIFSLLFVNILGLSEELGL